MIKRLYFMTYKTASVNGNYREGYRANTFSSWFPDPIQALKQMAAGVEKDIGQPVSATSFYRVR